jgi:hypothetical protein
MARGSPKIRVPKPRVPYPRTTPRVGGTRRSGMLQSVRRLSKLGHRTRRMPVP